MGTKLGRMTISSIFKKPETVQYPTETRPMPEGLKGHIDIDIDLCIFCGICEKCCPSGAITVDKEGVTWNQSRFRCVQCKSCVEQCPKDALRMEPQYASVAREKSLYSVTQQKASAEEIARKEEEKAKKVKAALEAKKAREQKDS